MWCKSYSLCSFNPAITVTDTAQQVCVNNMIQIASGQFGCNLGNATCYCSEPNFGYGIRDCADQSCSASDAAKVITFGTEYCESELRSNTGFLSIRADMTCRRIERVQPANLHRVKQL